MRTINTDEIIQTVKKMCIEANLKLSEDMEKAVRNAATEEDSVLGRQILTQLCENLDIAAKEQIPICQDTGMAVFFVNVGQDVHIEGMNLTDAINEGVRQGYTEGYLRKSVVRDPLIRENTKDNTPAIIHYDIVPGENIEITIAPKGFGSENMSRVFMLKPADGEEGVKAAVLQAVKDAGPNACPPMFVGVGLGGDFEMAAKLAKKHLPEKPENIHHMSISQESRVRFWMPLIIRESDRVVWAVRQQHLQLISRLMRHISQECLLQLICAVM